MNALAPVTLRSQPERMRFTQADVDLLVRVGVIAEGARIELIDGDLIEMPSEGGEHVRYKVELSRWFARALPDAWRVAPDSTLRLSDQNAPSPDLYIYPTAMREEDVRGGDVALVVELAVTTQVFDLQRKAMLYASHDVREYWVVDAVARRVHVHAAPSVSGYTDVRAVTYDEVLKVTASEPLALRMADLERL